MHYNFMRIHPAVRVTPAMAAGVTNTIWKMEDLVTILDRPIGPVIREVRIAFRRHPKGVSLAQLHRELEKQTSREWRESVVYAALMYMQGDEAESRGGLWFPEENWAKAPSAN